MQPPAVSGCSCASGPAISGHASSDAWAARKRPNWRGRTAATTRSSTATRTSPPRCANIPMERGGRGLRLGRQDTFMASLRCAAAVRRAGQLWQCLGQGRAVQPGDPGTQGVAVCDPPTLATHRDPRTARRWAERLFMPLRTACCTSRSTRLSACETAQAHRESRARKTTGLDDVAPDR